MSKAEDMAKAYRLGKSGVAKCRKCGDLFTDGGGLVIAGSGPHCRTCAGIVTGNVSEYSFDEEPEEEPE
jgi:hypothetical protein